MGPTRPRSCPQHPDSTPLGLKALRAFARLFYSPATTTTYTTNYFSEIREQAQILLEQAKGAHFNRMTFWTKDLSGMVEELPFSVNTVEHYERAHPLVEGRWRPSRSNRVN